MTSPCIDYYPIGTTNEQQSSVNDDVAQSNQINFRERLWNWNAMSYFLLLGGLLVYRIIKSFGYILCCRCFCPGEPATSDKYKSSNKLESNLTFFEAAEKYRLESYRLSQQAQYKAAFLITSSLRQMQPETDFPSVAQQFEKIRVKQHLNKLHNRMNSNEKTDKRKSTQSDIQSITNHQLNNSETSNNGAKHYPINTQSTVIMQSPSSQAIQSPYTSASPSSQPQSADLHQRKSSQVSPMTN